MSTRAIAHLKAHNVSFEITRYDHREKGAAFAAQATGFPLAMTVKTLVVDLGRGDHRFALMPGDRQLDLKRLAKGCGVKRAAMADTATAERLTGYLVGGISPFGSRKALAAVMEQSLMEKAQVLINAGQRGVMLKMNPADIARALDAVVLPIASV